MNKVRIIMYHYTRDLLNSRYPKINGLDVRQFKEQLDYLTRKYTIIRMEDMIECVTCNKTLPENAALLTFDDGYIDNFTYAFPILKNAGLQGSFFIPAMTFSTRSLLDVNKIHYILASADIQQLYKDLLERLDYYRGRSCNYNYPTNDHLINQHAQASRFDDKETIFVKRILQTVLPDDLRSRISSELFSKYVCIPEEVLASELYLNSDQLTLMQQQGMYIGIHGWNHSWLGNMEQDDMKDDINRALSAMSNFINPKAWVMCYPYGSHNDAVRNYIEKKGAVLGLTTQVDIAEITKEHALELPRLDCNDLPPKSNRIESIERRESILL